MTTSGDPRLPSNEPPRLGDQGSLTAGMHEYDPRATLLAHKGSPVPLEPPHDDPGPSGPPGVDLWKLEMQQRSRRAPPVFPTLATDPLIVNMPHLNDPHLNDPRVQCKPYLHNDPRLDPFYQIGMQREPLKPLYTEKLPASPRFPTIGEAAQRRRDFWMKTVARGGLGLMVAAPVLAFAYGTGVFPAGAFVAGLIIFAATCFISGLCKRT